MQARSSCALLCLLMVRALSHQLLFLMSTNGLITCRDRSSPIHVSLRKLVKYEWRTALSADISGHRPLTEDKSNHRILNKGTYHVHREAMCHQAVDSGLLARQSKIRHKASRTEKYFYSIAILYSPQILGFQRLLGKIRTLPLKCRDPVSLHFYNIWGQSWKPVIGRLFKTVTICQQENEGKR